ncbi:DivIVA domain-containing protein [Scrofimicrobium sp. R131]|uniref:Cell wall synthesis protein Wag31 n=1 Tax=Scrofimicrobium appendicitidis TaxID=3079930 RepID=A0AAU7V5Q6_9ACTO
MALLTAEDVLEKKFQVVKFREGYDQVEVDEFLDEVVATVYALQVENSELKDQLEAANRRIAELSSGHPVEVAPAPVVEEPVVAAQPEPAPVAAPSQEDHASATSMLALAQRLHDEYVNDGRAEGERIISEARQRGDEIVREAEGRRDSVLTQLDQDRGLLEEKINELRNFESQYRRSLTDHLQTLLQEVSSEN